MRLLQIALCAAVLAWAWAWQQTRTLPARDAILPELLEEPRQGSTNPERFSFEYRQLAYEVDPVASYELYGLVVSHNDIQGIADIYHDADSVDTKDLCVVWGENLRHDGYRQARYESTPHFCWVEWDAGTTFDLGAMSNSHLVTDNDALRARLEDVHIGDQIRFGGLLVNYRDMRHPEYWRRSSLVRTDQGNGACEVVFFDELDVLVPHAPGAWQARRALPWVVGVLLALMLVVAATTTPRRSEVRI